MGSEVYTYLENLGISFKRFDHPAVHTVEEAEKYWGDIDAVHCKNLFLRDAKGRQHFLVVAPTERNLDIRWLWEAIESSRLSFASEQRLMKYMGLKPGSVSPFGLINDKDNHVHAYLDASLEKADHVAFHPNVNTATLVISGTDLIRYMDSTGNQWSFLEIGG